MDADGHVAAVFLRVDVGLPGEPSREAYDALSERLQDLLQEAVLQPADGGSELDLKAMTCLVLGPVRDEDTIEAGVELEDHFAPVAEWLSYQDEGE